MNLFLPSGAAMRALQERENRWYFSAAFDVVLRRHGVLLGTSSDPAPSGSSGFVSRDTPWRDEFTDSPLVFEGPLHESVAQRLGVNPHVRSVEDLLVRTPDTREIVSRLVFPRPRPARRDKVAEVADHVHDQRWSERSFTFQEFQLDDSDEPLLLGDTGDGSVSPIAVRRGRALLLGIPALDLIARYDAIPPYDRGYPGVDDWADPSALELWLIAAAEELALECTCPVVRLGRWPHPHTWALTVRHDFDRPLDQPAREERRLRKLRYSFEVRRRLKLYRDLGIRSTWFWLGSAAHARTMKRVASRGHEVALHTAATSLSKMRDEIADLERVLRDGIHGMSAHGGGKAPGHLGLHHIEWALAASFDYGERIGGGYFLGPAVSIRDDVPASVPLMLPGQHIGSENGLGPDDSNLEMATKWLSRVMSKGGHAVVMNHPDVHFETLRTLLRSIDARPWSATLADVARWGHATQLDLQHNPGARDEVTFRSPLPYPAAIRIGSPDGWTEIVVPAGSTRVALDVKR